jgi:hypothetical protein
MVTSGRRSGESGWGGEGVVESVRRRGPRRSQWVRQRDVARLSKRRCRGRCADRPRRPCGTASATCLAYRARAEAMDSNVLATSLDRTAPFHVQGAMPRRTTRQLALSLHPPRRWGGQRPNAGRKPTGERAGVPHGRRSALAATHPAHVTLRVRSDVPSLRTVKLVRELKRRP